MFPSGADSGSATAAGLRHALRTPLNHIIGYCEMLLEENEHAAGVPLRGLIDQARIVTAVVQDGGEDVETLRRSLGPAVDRMCATVESLAGLFTSVTPAREHATSRDRKEAVYRRGKLGLHRSLPVAACKSAAGNEADENTAGVFEGAAEDLSRIRFAVGTLKDFADGEPIAGLSNSVSNAVQATTGSDGGCILVVDDNAENRDILSRLLVREGYGVTAVADGERALESLQSGDYDLMLLDVMMPVMDGFEVLRRMKEDCALRRIPVVMISALNESNSVVRCIQMGAEDYLMKPFDPVLLSARIGASLEKKHLRDEDRRRAEELQHLLDELRRTQDQLLVQENLASLGALTAGIAHEIRNPLNFINNFAGASKELIQEIRTLGPLGTEASALFGQLENYLEKIDEHGKRADRIVRGMLMHSRGKSGEAETVDLKCLLTDALNLAFHAQRAQDRGFNVRLETDFDPETGCIHAVPQEISRVFLNIVNNAFYAVWDRQKASTEPFHPRVDVRTRDLGGDVEIRVKDNGCGIPADVLPKIFNPFFTTKPAGAGTGLGLSLSYDIITRGHHGTIRAESVPGTGAEFIVTLPRKQP